MEKQNDTPQQPSKPTQVWLNEAPFVVQEVADGNADVLHSLLSSAMLCRNLVVLTGSGPSIAVKGPTMRDLWDLASALPGFSDVKDKVNYPAKAGKDSKGSEKQDIELLLTLCKLYQELGLEKTADTTTSGSPTTKTATKKPQSVESFVKTAEESIAKKCRDFLSADDQQLAPYQTLLERLVPRRNDWPRTRFFTTNYDLCLERAADSLGMPYIDGFSFSNPRHFNGRWFDVDFVRRTVEHGTPNFLENVFFLHKLHGSVDWERKNQGIIRCENPAHPCLIYPCSEKYALSYEQPYLEMMSRFQSALREPDTCLLIIGFGFNDFHLNELIFNALRMNSALKLIIYDHDIESKLDGDAARAEWRKLDAVRQMQGPVCFVQTSLLEFVQQLPKFADARRENDLSGRIAKLLETKATKQAETTPQGAKGTPSS